MAQNAGIVIKGTVVEHNQQAPIEFATIMLGNPQTKDPITGTTTDLDGTFQFRTNAPEFYIEISFIGYATKTISEFSPQNGIIDLGTCLLYTSPSPRDRTRSRMPSSA